MDNIKIDIELIYIPIEYRIGTEKKKKKKKYISQNNSSVTTSSVLNKIQCFANNKTWTNKINSKTNKYYLQ